MLSDSPSNCKTFLRTLYTRIIRDITNIRVRATYFAEQPLRTNNLPSIKRVTNIEQLDAYRNLKIRKYSNGPFINGQKLYKI